MTTNTFLRSSVFGICLGLIGIAGCTSKVTSDPPGARVLLMKKGLFGTDSVATQQRTPCTVGMSSYESLAVRWPDMTCTDWQKRSEKMHFQKSDFDTGNATIRCKGEIVVSHGKLDSPSVPVNMTVQIDELAANNRREKPDEVGATTFTVAALPTGTITTDPAIPRTLHSFVVEALETAGYSVVDMRGKEVAQAPLLRGELKNFWFSVYTWAAPLIYCGGTMELRLIMQKPDKTVIWERSYKTNGNGLFSLNDPIKQAVTKVLNRIIADVQKEGFKASLQRR